MPPFRSLRNRVVLSDKSNQVYKSSENSLQGVCKVGKLLRSCRKSKSLRKNENIPIWNRDLDSDAHKSIKNKNMENIDVYDISLDEEMSCEVATVKKKVKKHFKTNTNRKCKTKCLPISVEHHEKLDREILTGKSNINKEAVYKTDLKSSKLSECKINSAEKEVPIPFPDTLVEEIAPDVVTEENMDLEFSGVIAEPMDNQTFLLHLADELEKSLLVPKMTSTPTKVETNAQKSYIVKPNMSKVPYNTYNIGLTKTILSGNQKTVLTQENKPVKDNTDKDITLFESPTKAKKNPKQGKIKCKPSMDFIQINLFDDYSETPSSPLKLDETVIKPNKAYHTPDNFKNHLARTKRISTQKKRVAKSKEDIIIEKMSQHFEEIGGTELCVE